jgi:hypothetical protein
MTADERDKAMAQGFVVRDGLAGVLTDRSVAEMVKDMDRGGIKESKANKTGFNWFDRPRIDLTNYLAGLESNAIREGVVDGSIVSPDYDKLYQDMRMSYNMYLNAQVNKDKWQETLKQYNDEFNDKKFKSFADFMDSTLKQTTTTVDGILGLKPGSTSFGVKNKANVAIAKKEGVDMSIIIV